MKQGKTLTQLAAELEAQKTAAEDYLVDTRQMTYMLPTETQEGADEVGPVDRAVRAPGAAEISLPEGLGEFSLTRHAEFQLADRIGYPRKLWERFSASHPDLLMNDVNALLRREPERRMVRTFDWSAVPGREGNGKIARAILSDRYRCLDNYDLANAILPELQRIPDVLIPSCDLTDRRLYIVAVAPRISGTVKEGDVVQAGVVISNSEIGEGALSVQPLVYRCVCDNGMVVGKAVRRYHIGRQVDSDEALKVFRDETREADDRALYMKLADVVHAAVDEMVFNDLLVQMREAADTPPLQEPVQAVEKLAKKLDFGEGEQKGILRHLMEGRDYTAWGAANAVTRAAQDVESYDRSMELQEHGATVMAMAGTPAWAELAAA